MKFSELTTEIRALLDHARKHPKATLAILVASLAFFGLLAWNVTLLREKDGNDSDDAGKPQYVTLPENPQTGENACQVPYAERIVEGDSMEPFIKNGEKMVLLEKFFSVCDEKPKVGDIVAYRYGGNIHPLIKAVRATSNDLIEVFDDKIKVDGQVLRNSAGEAYRFKPAEIQLMNLFVRSGHIPQGSYLIFGDNVSNSIDSRKFGAVSASDFLGKFIKP